MNAIPFRIAASAALAALTIGGFNLARAQADTTPPASPTLDAETTRTLTFMREEERLARDIYTALEEKHGGDVAPFSRIKLSEQRHHDAVGNVLDQFGITDPSVGLAPGDYAFDELDTLYATLFAQGATLEGAFQAGIAVEEKDITDLREAIEASANATVDRVLSNLLSGSEQHLVAFERAASGDSTMGSGAGRQGAAAGRGQGLMQGDQSDVAGPAGRGVGHLGGQARGDGRQNRPADCLLA